MLNDDNGFLAVADGMGGAAAGEVASRIFIETADELLSGKRSSEDETAEVVRRVFDAAHGRMLAWAKAHPECRGMGCTAEAAAFLGRRYVVGHVGDSRTYLFRRGQLRQITKDHSLVQQQLDEGIISQEEARNHAFRNIILRAVGTDERLVVDIVRGELHEGDCLLLCSDGLTDMVDDHAIETVLSRPLPISQKVESLVDLARSAGGYDNITAVITEASHAR